MKNIILITCFFIFFNAKTTFASKNVILKIATLAPKSSYWYRSIAKMSSDIKKKTKGKVSFRIYSGGVTGDEGLMIRKLRFNQLHGAIISFSGLAGLEPLFKGFWFPLFYKSLDESLEFYDNFSSEISSNLKKNKFQVIMRVGVGPVYWFSRKQIKTPSDLKTQKIFVWSNDFSSSRMWKKLGYQAVPLSMVSLSSSLKTGMVDAFANVPIYALAYQLHNDIKYMLDLEWGYVQGAFVIKSDIFQKKLTAEQRKIVFEVAKNSMKDLKEKINSKNIEALNAMKKDGLVIYKPTQKEKKIWYDYRLKHQEKFRDVLIPSKVYDAFMKLRLKKDSKAKSIPSHSVSVQKGKK